MIAECSSREDGKNDYCTVKKAVRTVIDIYTISGVLFDIVQSMMVDGCEMTRAWRCHTFRQYIKVYFFVFPNLEASSRFRSFNCAYCFALKYAPVR